MFGIVQKLVVSVILGTSFNDNFIKRIFRTKRKIVPFNSPPVHILTVHEMETDKTEEEQTENIIKNG